MFLGEARYPGPAEHERDHTLEPHARRARINQAGDAVPGSQDSTARGVQHFHSKEHTVTPAIADRSEGFPSVFLFFLFHFSMFFILFMFFNIFHILRFFQFFPFSIFSVFFLIFSVFFSLRGNVLT